MRRSIRLTVGTLLLCLSLAGCSLSPPNPSTPMPVPSQTAASAPASLLATSDAAATTRVPASTAASTANAALPSATTPVPATPTTPPASPTLKATGTLASVTTRSPTAAPQATATQALPFITSFTAAPAQIEPGQPVTLTWQASADDVALYRLGADGRLAEFFNVAQVGSLALSPPAAQRGQVSFMLFAARGGATVSAAVAAQIRCPDTWFFANPPPICPASAPHETVMQAQYFERGLMLWAKYSDRIYILYGDQSQPFWDAQQNGWFPGQPETDPAIEAPVGYYQPVRGFGVAWRTGYVSPSQVVRDRLGWATIEEVNVPSAAVQCDSAPKYGRCYITGPGGVVYVLLPERSGWQVWTVP